MVTVFAKNITEAQTLQTSLLLDVTHLKEDHNFKTPERSSGRGIKNKRR